MKLIFGSVFLALVAVASAQRPEITVDEDLLAAQAELTIGHEFAETLLALNRGQLSAAGHAVGVQLIDSHMEAYGHMKNQILDTNATLLAIPVTPQNEACLDHVWNRWNLQVRRFGHRLAGCISIANIVLNAWDQILLALHVAGQSEGNQVPNLGVKVLTETNVFDAYNQYRFLINREFRDHFARGQVLRNQIDGFIGAVTNNAEEIIAALAECDRNLEDDLQAEIVHDLELAEAC